MKILFVRPEAVNTLQHLQIINSEPLELEYLHTVAIERNWQDFIYDGLNSKFSLKKVLKDFMPDVMAVTGYVTQEKKILEYLKLAKKINPKIITITGGVHAQLNYKNFYGDYTDYVFRSEDMCAFSDLLKYFEGEDVNLSQINGLCSKSDNVWIENKLLPFDINLLPIPERSFFYEHKSWFRYIDLKETATVKTSLSCPYNCNFCYCTKLNKNKYSVRDLEKVMQEIEELECESVLIADDVFLFDEKRVWDFIEEVKKRNIKKKFICYGRADYISSHEEQIKALVDIGFVYFLVGLESSSDNELDNYNKRVSANENVKCVEAVNNAGGRCYALMIVPLEADRKYFDDVYNWTVKNNVKYVTFSIFTPMHGTESYDEYKDKFITNDCRKWDFLHLVLKPEKLSTAGFYFEFLKLNMRIYNVTKKTGIFDFMNFSYILKILYDYFSQKIRRLI